MPPKLDLTLKIIERQCLMVESVPEASGESCLVFGTPLVIGSQEYVLYKCDCVRFLASSTVAGNVTSRQKLKPKHVLKYVYIFKILGNGCVKPKHCFYKRGK